ncbi:DUF3168 domain-containing protein [Sphingomonas panacisoli]|uniref:DUF3168 domain-containing protein n=1 Tax=Sphingomonas panacisoli TaxID=1813879 RepID=A0A5B8LL66_9SPHN|nr:DUF3168 domain-containing protein [Sphingomonas panacisoli]QDZ08679.1 DUF3168 domain-containing protein [Sphingomonas panacisoli]
MSAESVLAEAVLVALAAALGDQLNGVFDGPPVKASAPWVELGPLIAADWSTKDKSGREVRLALTVRDRADRPARTHALAAAAGGAVEAVPRDLSGWRIASLAFVRARVTGDRPGEWSASVEYQIKLLAT